MSEIIKDIMEFNKIFVEHNEYEKYKTTKYPSKKIAVLSCMDTRLTELLPAALNIKNGEVKIIKNAGGTVTHPFGSVMRSLLIAVYTLGVEEILVVGHHDCGIHHLDKELIRKGMKERNISDEVLHLLEYSGVDFNYLFEGFDDVGESVRNTVRMIRENPMIPKDVKVHGLLIDPETGELEVLVEE